MKTYTTAQIVKASGATQYDVSRWTQPGGWVEASVEEKSSCPNFFTRSTALLICLVKALRQKGAPVDLVLAVIKEYRLKNHTFFDSVYLAAHTHHPMTTHTHNTSHEIRLFNEPGLLASYLVYSPPCYVIDLTEVELNLYKTAR